MQYLTENKKVELDAIIARLEALETERKDVEKRYKLARKEVDAVRDCHTFETDFYRVVYIETHTTKYDTDAMIQALIERGVNVEQFKTVTDGTRYKGIESK